MPTEGYLRRRLRRLLERIQRAEQRLAGRDTALPSKPAGKCVEVKLLKARRLARRSLLSLAGATAVLCGNPRCVAVSHMGCESRPTWVLELSASLARWQKQLKRVRKQLKPCIAKRQSAIRSLTARIAAGEAELENAIGELGALLGLKANSPCVLVEDEATRRMLRAAIVQSVLGPRPENAYVCHRCDESQCVNGDHLFWGTAKDNARDCAIKGRRRGQDGTHLSVRIAAWKDALIEHESVLRELTV